MTVQHAPAGHDAGLTAPLPEVVHADSWLLAVVKPAGILAVPGRGEAGRDHLWGRVQALWPDALVVHRLDMATSGLMLFARGAAMQRALSIAFAQRAVLKRYHAWVHGLLGDAGAACGEIALPLAADWPRRPRQRVDTAAGKPALTHWQALHHEPQGQRTRVALQPVTGRTHQLRVHLAAVGHPIVGDALYGPPADPAPRLLLHACSLALAHPATGEALCLQHPPPF
jgi:tRNA pseudouridine32 synthase/23S rRNA pseudouridine746 synthase